MNIEIDIVKPSDQGIAPYMKTRQFHGSSAVEMSFKKNLSVDKISIKEFWKLLVVKLTWSIIFKHCI